jgi:hypothetical protein
LVAVECVNARIKRFDGDRDRIVRLYVYSD